MRKLLTIFALLLPSLLAAQEVATFGYSPAQIETTQVRYIGEDYDTPELYRHDFRIGMAATGLLTFFYLTTTFDDNFHVENETMSDLLAKYRFSYGAERLTPIISAEYSYAVNDWFAIGAKGSYASIYRIRKHATTGENVGRVSLSTISAVVNARFQWLNGDIVKMYSSLGFGVMSSFGLARENFFFYDATWVGLSVGKKVYGYFEFGGGVAGITRAGLGVRF